jgi:hypothetical protein
VFPRAARGPGGDGGRRGGGGRAKSMWTKEPESSNARKKEKQSSKARSKDKDGVTEVHGGRKARSKDKDGYSKKGKHNPNRWSNF